jgi:hypothetical protein
MWSEQEWNGCLGIDRSVEPAFWERLADPVAIPPDYTVRMVSHFDRLFLQSGDHCNVLQIAAEHIPALSPHAIRGEGAVSSRPGLSVELSQQCGEMR